MAHLSEIYITKEKLQTLLNVLEKKGENGIGITLSVNDESNEYGQNIGAYVTQTKEQREAKKIASMSVTERYSGQTGR